VGLETDLTERIETNLAGYKGMGPVRVGNEAYIQHQHDVYGQVVLSSIHAFFDQRLLRPATVQDFHDLEAVGERAFATHDQPDAGLWEFRTKQRVHTYSALMGWAACDRLGNAAAQLGLPERAEYWNGRAMQIRTRIEAEAWNADLGRFAAGFGGDDLDASLLQIVDLQFLDPSDHRYQATFSAIEAGLRRGPYLMRYSEPDDFGMPETAFNFCTFWFIEALHRAGRTEEARDLFEEMLRRRTHAGLLSEDMATSDGHLWGNYPQTYSLVGLINCAMMLSRPWGAVR
jgi:pentatricopeptide repeat protein